MSWLSRAPAQPYRVYAEDEFFACEQAVSSNDAAAPERQRAGRSAGIAALIGVVGAVCGVVALNGLVLSRDTARKTKSTSHARSRLRAATTQVRSLKAVQSSPRVRRRRLHLTIDPTDRPPRSKRGHSTVRRARAAATDHVTASAGAVAVDDGSSVQAAEFEFER